MACARYRSTLTACGEACLDLMQPFLRNDGTLFAVGFETHTSGQHFAPAYSNTTLTLFARSPFTSTVTSILPRPGEAGSCIFT